MSVTIAFTLSGLNFGEFIFRQNVACEQGYRAKKKNFRLRREPVHRLAKIHLGILFWVNGL